MTVGGVTYTHSRVGTYGTVRINAATGAYLVEPHTESINDTLSAASETFTVSATANGLVGQQTLTVAVTIAASAPGAPTSPAATAGDGSAEVSWTAPVWTGGSAVTGYRVETSTDGTNWTVAIADTGTTTTSATVTGLTNGTPTLFRVAAINGNGTGGASAPASATPRSVPGAPTDLAATPDDGTAALTWVAPVDGGSPITGYRVETSTDGTNWTVAIADTGTTTTSATVTGLTNGTPTLFRVAAINDAGTGGDSAPAGTTPRRVPGAPTSLEATPADRQVELRWTAPADDGGAPIAGYRVETSTDGTSWTVAIADTGTTTTSATVTGVTNGTPTRYRVVALNEAGAGAASAPAAATARTTAGAPTIASITEGNRSLTVTMTPPTDDGGAAVDGYEYSIDGGRTWQRANTTSTPNQFVVSPLPNGTTVSVLVRAVNAAGPGAFGAAVAATPVLGPVLANNPRTPLLPNAGRTLLVDGVERDIRVFDAAILGDPSIPAGTLRVTGDGFAVDLRGVDAEGAALRLDAQGRLVVVAGAYAVVSGEGFLPGTTVDVWLLSIPILLGEVTVGADGTFSARLPLPSNIAVGAHSLQLNGVSADNELRTVSVDVVVRDASTEIAFTGSDSLARLIWSPLLIGFGLVLFAATKRRRPVSAAATGRTRAQR